MALRHLTIPVNDKRYLGIHDLPEELRGQLWKDFIAFLPWQLSEDAPLSI